MIHSLLHYVSIKYLQQIRKLFLIIQGRVIGVTIGCIIGMTPIPIFSYFHNGG